MKRFTFPVVLLILILAATPALAFPQFLVWQDVDGDNLKDVVVGSITAYSGALTGVANYGYASASAHLTVGPTLGQYQSKMFLYSGPDGLSFNMVHNVEPLTPYWNHVKWDMTVTGTPSSVLLSDDGAEASVAGLVADGVQYRGDWAYINNTDGGIIGNLVGDSWEIMIDPEEFGDIQSWDMYSGDGGSVHLWDNPSLPPTGLGGSDHYH